MEKFEAEYASRPTDPDVAAVVAVARRSWSVLLPAIRIHGCTHRIGLACGRLLTKPDTELTKDELATGFDAEANILGHAENRGQRLVKTIAGMKALQMYVKLGAAVHENVFDTLDMCLDGAETLPSLSGQKLAEFVDRLSESFVSQQDRLRETARQTKGDEPKTFINVGAMVVSADLTYHLFADAIVALSVDPKRGDRHADENAAASGAPFGPIGQVLYLDDGLPVTMIDDGAATSSAPASTSASTSAQEPAATAAPPAAASENANSEGNNGVVDGLLIVGDACHAVRWYHPGHASAAIVSDLRRGSTAVVDGNGWVGAVEDEQLVTEAAVAERSERGGECVMREGLGFSCAHWTPK